MKRILYLFVVAMIASLASSCSINKLSPQAQREQAVADSIAYTNASRLLTIRSFLIKAKTIRIAAMGTKEVIPEQNFLMMNNGRATVCFSPYFTGSVNGVGGSTYEGIVENFKENISENGEIYITFNLAKGTKKAKVSITLPPNTGRAMVNVNGYATLYGVPQPYDPSQVIEGMH